MEQPKNEGVSEIADTEQAGSLPTTENLQQQMAELKARVEVARVQKEKDIEQKVTERESLIGEARSNEELLAQADETLDYFTAMQELGDLKDAGDIKRLEELTTLVDSLEQKRDEINQKIEGISSRPEILEKIEDAAQKEDVERAVNQVLEQAQAELPLRIDKIVEAIKDLEARVKTNREERSKAQAKIDNIHADIRSLFADLNNSTNLDYRDLYTEIDTDWINSDGDISTFEGKLATTRKSKGMFKGKERAIIDSILSKLPALKARMEPLIQDLKAVNDRIEQNDAESQKIKAEYDSVIIDSWIATDKISAVTGKEGTYNELVWKLQHPVSSIRMNIGRPYYEWTNDRTRDAAINDPRKRKSA